MTFDYAYLVGRLLRTASTIKVRTYSVSLWLRLVLHLGGYWTSSIFRIPLCSRRIHVKGDIEGIFPRASSRVIVTLATELGHALPLSALAIKKKNINVHVFLWNRSLKSKKKKNSLGVTPYASRRMEYISLTFLRLRKKMKEKKKLSRGFLLHQRRDLFTKYTPKMAADGGKHIGYWGARSLGLLR